MKQNKKAIRTMHNNDASSKTVTAGITLISLVITIIVLLILAGVSIATLTGENGILTQTQNAKEQTEIAEEKEIIELSLIKAKMDNGSFDEQNLQEELSKNSREGNKATIIDFNKESFTIKFESKRYYDVDNNQNIEYIENVTGEKILTVQCVNSNNEILAENKYTTITENYSKVPPTVEGYEAENEKIEGTITEDTTIKILYYYLIQEDDLIYTGLNSNGDVTTNDSEIVSYMIGDGASVGYREINEQCILRVPKYHKEKEITKIAALSFKNFSNLIIADIGSKITYIDHDAFHTCHNLKKIIIQDNVKTIGTAAFCHCSSLETLIIGDGIKEIPAQMCWNGYNLSYLYLGKNVNKLCLGILYGCTKLESIDISDENNSFTVLKGILYNKEKNELALCPPGISGKFTINDEVINIKEGAFYGCSLITHVDFGKGATSIRNQAFNQCTGLTEIVIEGNITDIASDAFHSCSNLKKIKLCDNVSNLLGACFCWCPNLESVEIGKGVKLLGTNLFYGDTKLVTLNYNGTIEEWNKIEKKTGWNANTQITTIVCTDGNVEI